MFLCLGLNWIKVQLIQPSETKQNANYASSNIWHVFQPYRGTHPLDHKNKYELISSADACCHINMVLWKAYCGPRQPLSFLGKAWESRCLLENLSLDVVVQGSWHLWRYKNVGNDENWSIDLELCTDAEESGVGSFQKSFGNPSWLSKPTLDIPAEHIPGANTASNWCVLWAFLELKYSVHNSTIWNYDFWIECSEPFLGFHCGRMMPGRSWTIDKTSVWRPALGRQFFFVDLVRKWLAISEQFVFVPAV